MNYTFALISQKNTDKRNFMITYVKVLEHCIEVDNNPSSFHTLFDKDINYIIKYRYVIVFSD